MSKPNRKIIRLQQMRAQIAQAAGVKWVDVVFDVPGQLPETTEERICSFLTQDYWPVDIVRAVEQDGDGTNLDVLKRVASPPEAFDDLVTVAQLTVGELKALIDELDQEAGTEPGEDSGSSSSSTSTPEPSAPTYSATTQDAA
ncbi:hypothetical protein GPZ77_34645 (plasmid) [Streptomyces sp. QHH-9511]|uniref:hypothetical protein n=1 Tax=Streptomyces sp. QHH-9511 TaxID=2684468 RepID=UPI001318530E|nr:hypothetical protein [Streptomyces sp. QHH-9511]QGZ53369.1 hypothetical protein GPZ77_34645 [Streptomyces sp. QHH-9511]